MNFIHAIKYRAAYFTLSSFIVYREFFKMCSKRFMCYLAIGLLVMGIFLEEVEARRKILRGRKTITRYYYRGTAIPAWAIVLLAGISMLLLGAGLFVLLEKFVINTADTSESHSYQPALQIES